MNIIEINNLCHRFSNGKRGIEGITLSVQEGSFVAIAGQNGSGKTTLLRHLNGLLLPDAGTVSVDGVSVTEDLVRARQRVGMVFQDVDTQIVGETVYEDTAFGPENLGLDNKAVHERVMAALAAVGLQEFADQSPHVLSGGERRRLNIAGILAMEPKVLVFDEPFSFLDYPGTRQLLREILKLHQAGKTILITTHDLEKVIAHADRLVVLKEGTIVRDDVPAALLKDLESLGVREPCESRIGAEIHSWLS